MLWVALNSVDENKRAKMLTTNVAKTESKVIFYFDSDDDRLSDKYADDLDAIVQYIKADPNGKFLIYGFTDERGTDKYNQNLSVRRAQSVFRALCEKGVPTSNLLFTGFGERGLVIKKAKTEEEHQKNRRVEIRKM